ncbi:SRPBCC domain-containing protein [Parasphingorhabdus sp.]|uniref:SRPBCC domain-containing protein n=1 Tax=Parasphingorhabdus sp. TaxID=2709688 RepID=UPI00300201E8
MDLKFKVNAHIAKPVAEVFEAVANPEKLSGYFTTGGAQGRLETGATVMWDFHDFPGAFPVEVTEVIPNEKISILWNASDSSEGDPYKVAATMTFQSLDDGRTLVTIAEGGWRPTEAGLASSYGNCYSWTQMLCALKMWIEHGINLREGFFK